MFVKRLYKEFLFSNNADENDVRVWWLILLVEFKSFMNYFRHVLIGLLKTQRVSLKFSVTAGQDGSIGTNALPPCTTIRRITTNFKMKNIQNCKKIELYGSPTTKDLKKPYSSGWAEGAEMGNQGGEDTVWWQQAGGGEAATTASRMCNPSFSCGG